MPISKVPKFVCPVCFNLDPSRCPESLTPSLLGEQHVFIPLIVLKQSAEQGDCVACSILYAGLECMEQGWSMGVEPQISHINLFPESKADTDQLLNEKTHLAISIRSGYSLRVVLCNPHYETTIEFYTLSQEGMALFLSDESFIY